MSDSSMSTMPLTGVLQDGPKIDLVPALKLNWAAQVLGGLVGAMGAACLGAGIGPYIVPSAKLPPEAISAIASLCATKNEHCDSLVLSQPHSGSVAILVGALLLSVQIFVLVWTGPSWRKKQ